VTVFLVWRVGVVLDGADLLLDGAVLGLDGAVLGRDGAVLGRVIRRRIRVRDEDSAPDSGLA
jgi:hypothetical protein